MTKLCLYNSTELVEGSATILFLGSILNIK